MDFNFIKYIDLTQDIISNEYINSNEDIYKQCINNINFEVICKGRLCANLYKNNDDNIIPIVRTTSKYNNPIQKFNDIHLKIIEILMIKYNLKGFNNGMIEIYDTQYCKMGYHTDNALDLEDNSIIAIFSCYNNMDTNNIRELEIKNKTNNEITTLKMNHNSLIYFDTEFNKNNLHKIILKKNKLINTKDKSSYIEKDDLWLGITFRLSKTYIKFINEEAYFTKTNIKLTLSTNEEANIFYKLKKIENNNISITYPVFNFTISPGDLKKK